MMHSTYTVGPAPDFVVDLYTGGEQRCHQPWNINGAPWETPEEAKAWALARIQQGIDHENWPPLDPALAPAPIDPPAPVDPPADSPVDSPADPPAAS